MNTSLHFTELIDQSGWGTVNTLVLVKRVPFELSHVEQICRDSQQRKPVLVTQTLRMMPPPIQTSWCLFLTNLHNRPQFSSGMMCDDSQKFCFNFLNVHGRVGRTSNVHLQWFLPFYDPDLGHPVRNFRFLSNNLKLLCKKVYFTFDHLLKILCLSWLQKNTYKKKRSNLSNCNKSGGATHVPALL